MKYHISFDIEFKRNTQKGLYLAFEGIDGSGKTVQVDTMTKYFEKLGKEVIHTSEPRRTGLIGELIDRVLQQKVTVPPASLQYLFTADRIANQTDVILPALAEGKVVLTHRCFWSAVPYGIMDRMEADGTLDYINGKVILAAQSVLSMYTQVTIPNITFYLDVSVDTALKRISNDGRAIEFYEKNDKMEKIKKGYEWLLQEFPNEFIRIDGEKGIEEVTDDVVKEIDNL